MNSFPIAIQLFAQAADLAAAATVPAAVQPAAQWWREPWAVWGMTLLTVAVPTLLSWLLAKRLRAADMWGRLATVLVALTAGAVITWLGWPPRLGIDLKGGVILVYEVDASRQATGQIDDCVGRIEQLLSSQDGRKGIVSRLADNRIAVRLETDDAAARESFLKCVDQLEF
jgi:preprotein translocase subunit SecD